MAFLSGKEKGLAKAKKINDRKRRELNANVVREAASNAGKPHLWSKKQ